MPADVANARIWVNAAVYVSFDLAAVNPATVAAVFPATWNLVGLLNGDDGFVTSRSEDVNDSFAWGGILMRTTRKNFKLTKSFTAFESNPVVNRLIWPGSTTALVKVPRAEKVKIAFETTDGIIVRRLISSNYAEVVPTGDIVENENDVMSASFVATIYPTAGGDLFTAQPVMDYFV